MPEPLTIRKATIADAGAIDALMKRSMAGLGRPAYDERQVASAVRFIASVDRQLIEDETYFVVEWDGKLVGCGGWSRREKLFSGPSDQTSARALDPSRDPARVRAMFVDPAFARRGIGRLILDTCESAARRERFRSVELMATLSGEALYTACGYTPIESAVIELPDGVILGGMKMAKALSPVVGRFAPSPTGPLHLGSLVAAVGSWLSARAAGGRWLVRIEDLDAPRVVPGSAEEIVEALRRYGLEADEEPVFQSRRTALYEQALMTLRERGFAYDCGCSRAEVQRAASAPVGEEPAYPGTCRDGLPSGKVARAIRFRSPDEEVTDFVIKRADGPFAYQLAVVVDDAAQGVTEVVRGADLLSSTPKQIALQRALGLPTPRYAHLPLVVGRDGAKLGKRDGALPLPTLDGDRIRETLSLALRFLGIDVPPGERMLDAALHFKKVPDPNLK